MALKSIFSVDLQKGSDIFKKFKEDFQKYRQQLDGMAPVWAVVGKTVTDATKSIDEGLNKLPKVWKDLGKETEEVKEDLKEIKDILIEQVDAIDKQVVVTHTVNEGFKKTLNLSKSIREVWNGTSNSINAIWGPNKSGAFLAQQGSNLFKGLQDTLKSTGFGALIGLSSSILSRASGIFSPLHFGMGLAGAGGTLFGLDLLGSAAGRGLRSSVGIGAGYGEQSAFGSTYGRLGDTSALLNAVSQAKANVGGPEWAALTSIGVDTKGDTAQVSKRVLDRARQLSKQTPEALWQSVLVEGFGLGNAGVGVQDLRRLNKMSDSEYGRYAGQFSTRSGQLGVDESTLRKWQDFVNTLDVTGKRIESSLIRGLAKATGPLEKLSDAAASVVEKFVGSKSFDWMINKITDGLSIFGDYISSPKFQSDMRMLWDGLSNFAAWLQRWFGATPAQSNGGTGYKPVQTFEDYRKEFFSGWLHKGKEGDATTERIVRENYKEYLKGQGQAGAGIFTGSSVGMPGTMASVSTPDALLDLVAKLEASGDTAVSPAGAVGKYQIMPGTAAGYGVSRQDLFDVGKNKEVASKIIGELSSRYKGNTEAILAAYNAGPMIGDYIQAHPGHLPKARPDNQQPWDYQQTSGYLARAGIRVTIDNPAGADVNTQVNQLGGSYPAVPGVVPR